MDALYKFFFSLENNKRQSRFIHALRSSAGQERDQKESCVLLLWALLQWIHWEQCNVWILEGCPKSQRTWRLGWRASWWYRNCTRPFRAWRGERPLVSTGFQSSFIKSSGLRWAKIFSQFLMSFKDILLPLSCRRAVITFLPKKGDVQEIKTSLSGL